MKKTGIRILCLLLCLMLPLCALADNLSFDYSITFDMNAEAYPAADQEVLTGVADLLDMTQVNGNFNLIAERWINIFGDFILDKDEATRTTYRIWGPMTHWAVQTSLLGDTKLVINHEALLEFCLKANSWLGLPLQNIALLVSPYSWENGTRTLRYIWNYMLGEKPHTMLITNNYLHIEADYIANELTLESGFSSLLDALFLDLGLDDFARNFFDDMPAWLDTFLDDEGIQITVDEDGSERWTTGDLTLFEKTANDQGYTFQLVLPTTTDDWNLSAEGDMTDGTLTVHILLTDDYDDTQIDGTVAITNWPESFPFVGESALVIDLDGYAFLDPVKLSFELAGTDKTMTFVQRDGETGDMMLTVMMDYAYTSATGDFYTAGEVMEDAVDIMSINDESLATLTAGVKDHFMDAVLPILTRMPSTSYQSVFALLEQYGILDMLLAGGGLD